MKKMQNNILQQFIDNLIEELKEENKDRKYNDKKELNIPFIISSLYQSFENHIDSYEEFINDLKTYFDYQIIIRNPSNNYNGIIDVDVNLIQYKGYNDYEYDYPGYNYKICFFYDERDYGWCECTPDMEDYREDKHCCGHGCDASFCSFSLHKVVDVTSGSWDGDEHDYWDFEDEFYMNEKDLAEKREQEKKKREIQELKNRMNSDSKKLADLTSDFSINVDEEMDKYKKVLEFMKNIGL